MERPKLNFRDHIMPLVIADTIFTIGLALMVLVWVFGDDPDFLGGILQSERMLVIGIAVGLALGGGIMMLNAIFKMANARRNLR